jgi:voltage-gated potassium channel
MAKIQQQLSQHIVVLGFGVSGSEAVKELIARGTEPARIVAIDPVAARLAVAEAMGCNVLEGDATLDQTLVDVRIGAAQTVLVSAGRDDASILIVLTVRHLAPHVPISVVIRQQDNELLARQAGANNVINPVSFTGLLLAGSAQGAHIADYMADLASVTGKVQLNERPVAADEIGKSLDELSSGGRGLRLYRSGQPHGFWEPEARALQSGDTIVEVIRCEGCEADKGRPG